MSTMALDCSMASLSLESPLNETAPNNGVEFSSSSSSINIDDLNKNATVVDASASSALAIYPPICRYFQRGICRFGSLCRFSHDLSETDIPATPSATLTEQPSTSRRNWANAPIFVPKSLQCLEEPLQFKDNCQNNEVPILANADSKRSWADVVGTSAHASSYTSSEAVPGVLDEICPYDSPCPYGVYCVYSVHYELCEMCDQFCLHPKDEAQRKKHKKECLQQHEQAMELSFAIARSKDKTCGICFDTIMEKTGREKRFGILPNCNHIFCLECIRKWRQAKQFEHKITRSCPECRVSSDFVCPSAFWVETKEEKDKLLFDYRKALGLTDCKYFKKGDGKCPFGNKCFYRHALPDGELVDVGCPKKARKLHRSNNDIINFLDIYLYEYLEQRDLRFLDFLASSTSDESDFGDDFDD